VPLSGFVVGTKQEQEQQQQQVAALLDPNKQMQVHSDP
jgi:hypothetical protein